LREFLDQHGERLINDPLKRAMLLHDLWSVFDWAIDHYDEFDPGGQPLDKAAREAQGSLRDLLAESIHRMLLDPTVIDQLPDSYALAVASGQFAPAYDPANPDAPFLPPDLFDPAGPWVCVNGGNVLVPRHANGFPRSIFKVFLRLPSGRDATKDYLRQLAAFKQPRIFQTEIIAATGSRIILVPNPELPQFPAGTQLALVRSAMLIDTTVQLHASGLVETVQLRVFNHAGQESVFQFNLDRRKFFAGINGGLDVVARKDRDFFPIPLGKQMDELEWHPNRSDRRIVVLETCAGCHRGDRSAGLGGIFGFNTFLSVAATGGPPLYATTSEDRDRAAIAGKRSRYDWGLLEGMLIKSR
jgi:hypothetical protein